MVRWVVFDLGETLVDETSNWDRWADFLEVPRFTFHAVFGATIAARRPHQEAFDVFRPGFDLTREAEARAAAGVGWAMSNADLYEDALPTLTRLREHGYRLAVFANQPRSAEAFLASLPVDRAATSAAWGLAKPDPAFFARVAQTLDVSPEEIAYVGDRVDNDVLPASAAGMLAVHLRRGPWGYLHATWPEVATADIQIDSLTELPAALARSAVRGDRRP